MADLETLKKHVENFLSFTQEARYLSERDRDYRDNKQWTAEEESKLRARGQAAIVNNRIKPKVEGLKGLLVNRRTDPKAFPRTPKHDEVAEAITDALRFVADNVDLDDSELQVAENVFVEGYGGAIVDVKPNPAGEIEIQVAVIPWDRIFYDAYSRKLDFSDVRHVGIIIWMDADVATENFPDAADIIEETINSDGGVDETFEDRPMWREIQEGRKRIRIAQEFYLEGGEWQMAFYTGAGFLIDPAPSPYQDEFGEPTNPIELQGAYIDRDNNRFGEVRYWIDPQNEINHRRSKALFLLSSRQTAARKGAVKDIPALKRELAKPNGHVEYEGEKGDFEVLQTGDMAQAQFELLQEAKNEIDATSFNAQLSGERQGDLSGKAVNLLQMAGTLEIASLYAGLSGWKKRIYRQIWARIRQFWTREKWVRVTDDDQKLRWVGLNTQVTLQQLLEETINDESLPLQVRQQASVRFMRAMRARDPRLAEIVEVRNNVAEMDVDIILEQQLNTVNVQQEQFELLARLAENRPEIPFTALLKLSELRNKEELIKGIEEQQAAGVQTAVQRSQAEAGKANAEADEKTASATLKNMEAIQKQLENQLLLESPPDKVTSVAV